MHAVANDISGVWEEYILDRFFVKGPDVRVGVGRSVARIRAFGRRGVCRGLIGRLLLAPGEQARGEAVGDKAARVQPIERIEQGDVALVAIRYVVVGGKGLDGVFELIDRLPSNVVNAIE